MVGGVKLILLLLGCCCSEVHQQSYYYIENLELRWIDAREYCRSHYSDLATFESYDDINRLQSNLISQDSWIGLWDDPNSWREQLGSDPNSWRWSTFGEPGLTSYMNWRSFEPSSYYDHRKMFVIMVDDGKWDEVSGYESHPFVCYTVINETAKVYTYIPAERTWRSAQHHCRSYFTDLALIENQAENHEVYSEAENSKFWIGLYRVPWTWSNGSPLIFTNWKAYEPDGRDEIESCVALSPGNEWFNSDCNKARHFICQTDVIQFNYKSTVKIQIQTAADVTDPTVNTEILQQLDSLLTQLRWTDVNLYWTSPPSKKKKKEET